ncbi:hypothetical protein DFH09DRAFT_1329372 [Mycena vulgaris]|nr:hypothetical protein DFH09DRAFT_1329372 [Mycena vulgaris]
MNSATLSQTPLFRHTSWNSQPLTDGSWVRLDPGTLGEAHATFLAALKELDIKGIPLQNALNLDATDFRVALGLETATAPISSTYNTGRAQAWACLLHFQVLDMLLAIHYPKLPALNHLSSLPEPTYQKPKQALNLLKPLVAWWEKLATFKSRIQSPPNGGPQAVTPSSLSQVESLCPVLAFAEIEAKTHETKTFKNLQAMAAGLMWILEAFMVPPTHQS